MPPPPPSPPSPSPPPSSPPPAGPLPRDDSLQCLLSELSLQPASPAPTVHGVDAHGSTHTAAVTPTTPTVALSGRGLTSVHLSALLSAPATALHELSLAANALHAVDLSPLSSTPALRVLSLNGNSLSSVDLSPLSACPHLTRLWLHDNALSSIDLSPLSACRDLRSLYLDANALHTPLDLSPLSPCTQLRALRLSGNRLGHTLDVTPLLSATALSQLVTDADVRLLARAARAAARSVPALRRRALDIDFRAPDGGGSDAPAAPPRAPPTFAPVTPSVRRRAAAEGSAAPAAPVGVLLVGFRRLGRYAAEDALSRCGRVLLQAVDTCAATADPEKVLAAHVVALQAPSEAVLRAVVDLAADAVPVVVFGSERYRGANAGMLRAVLGEGLAEVFVPDPATATGAAVAYRLGAARAARLQALVPRGRARSALPGRRAPRARGLASWSTGSLPDLVAPRGGQGAGEVVFSDDEDDASPVSIELSESPPRSLWAEVSERLRRCRRASGAPPPPAQSAPSLDLRDKQPVLGRRHSATAVGVDNCPELRAYRAKKTRAELAALELAFAEMGGFARAVDSVALARTVGLPKCAARLLFDAARAASVAVEATTPEPGVPTLSETHEHGGVGMQRVSSGTFLQYWKSRLQPCPPEVRLANVISDSRPGPTAGGGLFKKVSRASASGAVVIGSPSPYMSAGNAKSLDCLTSSSLGNVPRSMSNDSSCSSSSASSTNAGPDDFGDDGLAGLKGCDAGVGDLVRAFLFGRQGRFGMFALVKPSEAVAIATSLLLLALRGESGSRVGGRARPVSTREMCNGRLNAALIAAEAGIFDGVGSCLTMDKIRRIKGQFAAEAAPEAVTSAQGCALNYFLAETEIMRYNSQRQMLLSRGVKATLVVHCHGRKHMSLSEFAVMHTASSDLTSAEAADYFFSTLDCDQDDRWSLADLRHFHAEKERALLEESMALSGLWEMWSCLSDMVRPANREAGVTRAEFLRLAPSDRKTVIESLLFKDDQLATLNIRMTAALENEAAGRNMAVAEGVAS